MNPSMWSKRCSDIFWVHALRQPLVFEPTPLLNSQAQPGNRAMLILPNVSAFSANPALVRSNRSSESLPHGSDLLVDILHLLRGL